jgi:transposase
MRSIHEFSEIYLYRSAIDGRKAINGLSMIVQSEMKKMPFHGGLFVFISKRRDIIRILYWDRSGFALWMKRLEEEKFCWPFKSNEDVISITSAQLSWLLDGLDVFRMKPHQSLTYHAVS